MNERKLVRLTEVVEKPQEWLWKNRIPAGAITDLAGDPAQAKSRIVYDIAARITKGLPMPGEEVVQKPAGVILIQTEDDAAAVVKPTLKAMGANMSKIYVYDPQLFANKPLSLPDDMNLLRDAAQAVKARLIVVDPATSVFACNPNVDQSVRQALRPLADLAAELKAGVVVVRHLHKARNSSLMHRGAGSIAWVATARSGLLAGSDPSSNDPYRHLLVQTKSNLPGAKTMAYRTVLQGGFVVVEWLGEVDITARDLDGGADMDQTKLREALDVLFLILAEQSVPAGDVIKKGNESGVAKRTLERAKAALGVTSEKRKYGGSYWQWVWKLPVEDNPLLSQIKAKYLSETAAVPEQAVAHLPA